MGYQFLRAVAAAAGLVVGAAIRAAAVVAGVSALEYAAETYEVRRRG